jgi:hypothetical protein
MISIVRVSHHEIYLYVTILSWQSLATHEIWVSSLWMFYGTLRRWKLSGNCKTNELPPGFLKTFGVGWITGIHLICVSTMARKDEGPYV